ncbi:hypothetical protein U1U22_001949 [Proteus mirabilis]|uniref:hypothetical protein n=1 Tax=Proteus mirabilis TaxID=584 RepID=UPI0015833FF5|nr:hypothetical protein [Proteus mirabilis]ELZ9637258.1 hypothetical protein [Proteus mirabilis]MDM3567062.1 hypothetical protein [Proteus mirabilis]MDM3578132.1 hypothetical protein [Proteus mirabilis]HEI8975153.1 hypothetical protein [Proteus mirabilis]
MCRITHKGNKNSKVYDITYDDSGEEINVYLDDDKQGFISLNKIETDNPKDNCFRITHLELGKCKRQGIGTYCLEKHKELFNSILTAGSSDGQKCDDGSHLTGDGAPFIEKMREQGIVEPEPEYDEY